MSKVYRQAALDRLSSPDQLDILMQVVNPQSWLTLFSIALIICAGVAGIMIIEIPIEVAKDSMILNHHHPEVHFFVLPEESGELSEGMTVSVMTQAGKPQAFQGVITSISSTPASLNKNQNHSEYINLVLDQIASPTVVEVIAKLNVDNNEVIESGTLAKTIVEIDSVNMLELIIPYQLR